MHFIQEQKTPVGVVKRAAFIAICAGERTARIAEQRGGKQLGVIGIIGAVQFDEGFIGGDDAAFQRLLVDK